MLNGDGNENGIKINRPNRQKKKKIALEACFFVHFFAVVLHDYNPDAVSHDLNVKLPSYTLFLWKNCRMCSPKFLLLVFLFAFIFSLPIIFTLLAASIYHFLTAAMKFSCFSSNEIRLLYFQSLVLVLSLLST